MGEGNTVEICARRAETGAAMDVHTSAQRSANMRAIRSRNTKPEMLVRRYLHKNGLRYRLNVRSLPGTPDIVLPSRRLVIFVQGCFWHSHDCRFGRVAPKTNSKFWADKRARTVERDSQKRDQLLAAGWSVMQIWECETTAELVPGQSGLLAAVMSYNLTPNISAKSSPK
jgi:DNA mismatch endonuclease (patch repair protein)